MLTSILRRSYFREMHDMSEKQNVLKLGHVMQTEKETAKQFVMQFVRFIFIHKVSRNFKSLFFHLLYQ